MHDYPTNHVLIALCTHVLYRECYIELSKKSFDRFHDCLCIAIHYTCNIDWVSYHDDDDFATSTKKTILIKIQKTDEAFMILLMLSLNLAAS